AQPTAPAPGPVNEAPVPAPTPPTPAPTVPEPVKTKLKVSNSVGTGGLRMRKYPSLGGALVMTLSAGTILVALEPIEKVKAKVGAANKWIYVREPGGKRGYVSAQYVQLS
ncbi:MAG: SH3 domain-containing protein, partial [Anaerolineae bacterium]|nr:SH3 domain-containing protein [Anaerolineae bacterium]